MSDNIADVPLIERLRVVSIEEAASLANMSMDTIRRHHRDKFIKLSPRRIGMRLGDALRLRVEEERA
jgi:hypothetical protein